MGFSILSSLNPGIYSEISSTISSTIYNGAVTAYAISRSGTTLAYVTSDNAFYVSTDSGVTITQYTDLQISVDSLVISNDGNYAIAYNVASTATSGNFAYITTNGGTTWSKLANVNTRVRCATMSSSGQYMCITSKAHGTTMTAGGFWVSSNYGANWSQPTTSPTGWGQYGDGTCSMLADGSIMIYCTRNGTGLFRSSNFGSTFIKLTISAFQNFQGKQQTGCYVQSGFMVFASTTFVYSLNNGSTWTSSSRLLSSIPVNVFRGLATPSSGPSVILYYKGFTGSTSKLYQTTDFGVTESLYVSTLDVPLTRLLTTSDNTKFTLVYDSTNSALILITNITI
jgi:hypothetical protein